MSVHLDFPCAVGTGINIDIENPQALYARADDNSREDNEYRVDDTYNEDVDHDTVTTSAEDKAISALHNALACLIESYEQSLSRFRSDSLLSSLSQGAKAVTFPDYASDLFDIYSSMHVATRGAFSPLVGEDLIRLGYGKDYSFSFNTQNTADDFADPRALVYEPWIDNVNRMNSTLYTRESTHLDFGAAGKGFLVDLIAAFIDEHYPGLKYTIDASGDILTTTSQTVALENPFDTTQAIGLIDISEGSLCASAPTRRQWHIPNSTSTRRKQEYPHARMDFHTHHPRRSDAKNDTTMDASEISSATASSMETFSNRRKKAKNYPDQSSAHVWRSKPHATTYSTDTYSRIECQAHVGCTRVAPVKLGRTAQSLFTSKIHKNRSLQYGDCPDNNDLRDISPSGIGSTGNSSAAYPSTASTPPSPELWSPQTISNHVHHLLNALTGQPTQYVAATWVYVKSTKNHQTYEHTHDSSHGNHNHSNEVSHEHATAWADALATALFTTNGQILFERLYGIAPEWAYVRVLNNGTVETSPNWHGEIFTQ